MGIEIFGKFDERKRNRLQAASKMAGALLVYPEGVWEAWHIKDPFAQPSPVPEIEITQLEQELAFPSGTGKLTGTVFAGELEVNFGAGTLVEEPTLSNIVPFRGLFRLSWPDDSSLKFDYQVYGDRVGLRAELHQKENETGAKLKLIQSFRPDAVIGDPFAEHTLRLSWMEGCTLRSVTWDDYDIRDKTNTPFRC